MSHTKIAPKLLEVIRQIPNEQELGKLNEVLASQKLISKTEYEVAGREERIDSKGVVWQVLAVSCRLTIIDVESDEEITNTALGIGIDAGTQGVSKAQAMARKYAWMAALNITHDAELVSAQNVVHEPKIIVETPESKLIDHITAMWQARWDIVLLQGWIEQRFKKQIEQLNITELSVVKSELENYGR
jgi:hypothetical protein